jgi:hypothetical protein
MDVVAGLEGASVNYKGVDYTLIKTGTVDVWKWQFQVGNIVRTGNTETKLDCWPDAAPRYISAANSFCGIVDQSPRPHSLSTPLAIGHHDIVPIIGVSDNSAGDVAGFGSVQHVHASRQQRSLVIGAHSFTLLIG